MTKYSGSNPTEVEEFLNSGKDGVIEIGRAYQEGHDYRAKARAFIETHYAFEVGEVLFKPTFTHDVVFRNSPEDALSYFVSGDIAEDSGFALKPWEEIKESEVNLMLEDNLCAAMGVLNLKLRNSETTTRIAFTFILVKANGQLRIKIHHSSEIK